MWVFVNCLIENPSFDSQTKENMTLQAKSFGSKCNMSEKFIGQVSIVFNPFFIVTFCGVISMAVFLSKDVHLALAVQQWKLTCSLMQLWVEKWSTFYWCFTVDFRRSSVVLWSQFSAGWLSRLRKNSTKNVAALSSPNSKVQITKIVDPPALLRKVQSGIILSKSLPSSGFFLKKIFD